MATPSRARRIYDHLGTNGTILAVIGIILAAAAILVPVYVSSGSTTTTTTNNYGTQPQPEFDGQTKTCPAAGESSKAPTRCTPRSHHHRCRPLLVEEMLVAQTPDSSRLASATEITHLVMYAKSQSGSTCRKTFG